LKSFAKTLNQMVTSGTFRGEIRSELDVTHPQERSKSSGAQCAFPKKLSRSRSTPYVEASAEQVTTSSPSSRRHDLKARRQKHCGKYLGDASPASAIPSLPALAESKRGTCTAAQKNLRPDSAAEFCEFIDAVNRLGRPPKCKSFKSSSRCSQSAASLLAPLSNPRQAGADESEVLPRLLGATSRAQSWTHRVGGKQSFSRAL
jgi:hypothetical protein